MWKTGKSIALSRPFFPQEKKVSVQVFNRQKIRNFCAPFSTACFFHKRKSCGSVFTHRQELMLAVISRMLFCRVALPLCRDTSTLRMA